MLQKLGKGDEVITRGGVIGKITGVCDDGVLVLELQEKVRVRVPRAYVEGQAGTARSPECRLRKSAPLRNVRHAARLRRRGDSWIAVSSGGRSPCSGSSCSASGTLAPTFPARTRCRRGSRLQKKINLGLDLQGGMHIVYSIDLDKAVDDKASRDQARPRGAVRRRQDRRRRSRRRRRRHDPARRGHGDPWPTRPSAKAEVESEIDSDYGDDHDQTRDVRADRRRRTRSASRSSTSYADGIKKAALTNAVTTIRERINEKGVAEPSVVEKGDDIIVELPGDPDDPVDHRDQGHHRAHREARVQGRRRRLRAT